MEEQQATTSAAQPLVGSPEWKAQETHKLNEIHLSIINAGIKIVETGCNVVDKLLETEHEYEDSPFNEAGIMFIASVPDLKDGHDAQMFMCGNPNGVINAIMHIEDPDIIRVLEIAVREWHKKWDDKKK
jgi:hypothetical protein